MDKTIEMYRRFDAVALVMMDAIKQRSIDEEKRKEQLAEDFSKLVKERIAA
tara:strand:+ start:830 stop:982 length:153 start_codon:yes stop_codon:yes gene_type:complete